MTTLSTTKVPVWVWVSVIATAFASLLTLIPRVKAEAENRAVGIVLEMPTVRQLAFSSGKSATEALAELKEIGVAAMSLSEESVGDLIDQGRLRVAETDRVIVLSGSSWSIERVRVAAVGIGLFPDAVTSDSIAFPVSALLQVRDLGLGLDPNDVAAAKEAGLALVGRYLNRPVMTAKRLTATLEQAAAQEVIAYLPAGEQVLGYRTLLDETVAALEAKKIQYLAAEFVKTAGDSSMAREMPDLTVRLHAIQQAEIDRMSPTAITERYVKAFRERNIRWLLVRPANFAGEDPWAAFTDQLRKLRRGIEKEGGALRTPRPFQAPTPGVWAFLLIGLSAAPVVVFAGFQLITAHSWRLAGAALVGLLALACWSPAGRPWMSLLIAIAFPVFAYLRLLESQKVKVWTEYLLISGISIAAGLGVAGLNVSLESMIQVQQFSGVKLAQFAPILIIGGVFLLHGKSFKSVSREPILWGAAILGLVLLVALLFMMSRSGNESPTGVSSFELQFRALLDRFLYTRPRTKEFLIGHPALVLGLFWLATSIKSARWRAPAMIALAVSTFGQTSIINTFCHLHTPLDLSLARVLIGLVLGGIIGGLATWGASRGTARAEGN